MKAQIVSFHCVLKDKLGRIVSTSFNKDVINQLEAGKATLKGLVAGLQNVKPGEKREIFVPADQAYGLYDPKLVVDVSRNRLANGRQLELGSEIVTQGSVDSQIRTYRVVETKPDSVTLDGNHPLAGQDLTFEVEITSAQDATEELLSELSGDVQVRNVH